MEADPAVPYLKFEYKYIPSEEGVYSYLVPAAFQPESTILVFDVEEYSCRP